MTFYLSRWARRDLGRFPRPVRRRIVDALRELRDSGGGDVTPLGDDLWRLRIGDYRVFYGRREEDVYVLKVIHRKKGYAPEMIDTLIRRLELLKGEG